MSSLNRRDFLRTSLAGSFLLSAGLSAQEIGPKAVRPATPGVARNLIFLVSDGMSLGTLTLAERHLRRHAGRGTHWLGLYGQSHVRRALQDTSSASSLVTDSAAAASAWGCGHKVKNGSINLSPEGRAYTPLYTYVRESGRATGLVTTATITHATPAGFAAQVGVRAEESEIAVQYLNQKIDVLLGGGVEFFDAKKRSDGRDLFAEYRNSGYTVAQSRADLLAAPAVGRLLGVFNEGHLPYSIDQTSDEVLSAQVPTLAEMAQVALERLATHPEGFALQIEGARVDHAAHANDVGALLQDQLAFDEALGVALAFAANRDDTLVIVTSDHGNANPGLNGNGGNFVGKDGSYGDTNSNFDRVAAFRKSNTWVMGGLTLESTPGHIRDRVKEATALDLRVEEAELLHRALRSEHRESYRVNEAPLVTLGQILSNHTSVGWTGVQHTADFTELAAFGPGSERIGHFISNHELFGVMTQALGVKVRA